ncbi:hypothetical protein BT96DRAFT_1027659 [Gymnopus androsaceus JB14]|uniref:Post-GPI attachment to proteins factor 3 n=1 Tax=Gymnopus androsaceus JB14 TaxID=1447944 RepID=A0A6A4GAC7_9AGAR|nr:hypothetical protein BT96DRAFT_1027659 [Gymnopus androsaceus JB14]
MQEPMFSVLNLWTHLREHLKIRAETPPFIHSTWTVASMSRWIPLTEKLDYFLAALTILAALHFTVVRLFCLYQYSMLERASPAKIAWTAFCAAATPALSFTFRSFFASTISTLDSILLNLIISLSHPRPLLSL